MEASVVTTAPPAAEPSAPPEAAPAHDGAAEATRSTEELFQWSGYVHVGVGAEECELRVEGGCTDKKHFHAWVCLPNPYQVRDIVDKARAARARKSRALRDAGTDKREASDSYVTLEDELDNMRRPGDYEQLLGVIARRTIERSLIDILDDLQKDERFENHAQDAEEFRRQQEIPEEERDKEEYERLQADMLAYGEEMQKVIDDRTEAEITNLKSRPQDEVIDIERQARIDEIASEVYLHTYYTWAIYTGAREPSTEGFPSVRKFADALALKVAPPEVIFALREKIRTLEQRTVSRGDAAGN